MSERNEIFHAIQQALTGHSEAEGMAALISSLVVAIGVASDSMEQAKRTIDALPADMKRVLFSEWDNLRKHRAKADLRRAVEAAQIIH